MDELNRQYTYAYDKWYRQNVRAVSDYELKRRHRKQHEWYVAHREEILKKRKAAYQSNKEYHREYNSTHKERRKEYYKKWYAERRDAILAKRREKERLKREEQRSCSSHSEL